MKLSECATPALVLDRGKLLEDARRMLARCHARGTRLRPHLKTLKSVEAARHVLDPEHGGIAVSTLREVEYFAGHGFNDIQLAVCLTPDKLQRAAGIAARAACFSFFVDNLQVVRALVDMAASDIAGRFNVWIEVDCGEHRTGLLPDDPLLIELGRLLSNARGVRFEGVATHAGHAYAARGAEAQALVAECERVAILDARHRLSRAGIPVDGVSVGSTPTAVYGRSCDGITELRAGVYMVGDLFQANIGTVPRDAIALSVLATVISHSERNRQIVIDAGGLALSKDRSTAQTPADDFGYGLVLDAQGHAAFGSLKVSDVHQEHGEIRDVQPGQFAQLPIGARVRVLPNHACMTAAMYGDYWIVDGGDEIVDRWSRTNGW